jgi:putative transposase
MLQSIIISIILKNFKGRTSRKLQMEFPELKGPYWGQHFLASGYGVCSTGNITDKIVNEYLEHHRKKDDDGNSCFILE